MAVYENKKELLHFEITPKLDPLPHFHKEVEMIYVRHGKSRAVANRSSYELSDGDLFISFPHQIHYFPDSEIGEFVLLILSPKVFFGLDTEINSCEPSYNVVHVEKDSRIAGFMEEMVNATGKYKMTEYSAYINLTMAEILPQLSLRPAVQNSNATVKSILEYCSSHYTENITLDSISENLHLNKYYISHVINKQTDMKLSDFVNSLRINSACDLLRDTDKKIADISEDVGFGAIRSFNRTFLSLLKITPKEYLEMHRGKLRASEDN